jgi:hypothetical protein
VVKQHDGLLLCQEKNASILLERLVCNISRLSPHHSPIHRSFHLREELDLGRKMEYIIEELLAHFNT